MTCAKRFQLLEICVQFYPWAILTSFDCLWKQEIKKVSHRPEGNVLYLLLCDNACVFILFQCVS